MRNQTFLNKPFCGRLNQITNLEIKSFLGENDGYFTKRDNSIFFHTTHNSCSRYAESLIPEMDSLNVRGIDSRWSNNH